MVGLLVGWLVGGLVGRLVDWLVGWSFGRLVDWSIGRLVGWLDGWLVGLVGWLVWSIGRLVGWLVCWLAGWFGLVRRACAKTGQQAAGYQTITAQLPPRYRPATAQFPTPIWLGQLGGSRAVAGR